MLNKPRRIAAIAVSLLLIACSPSGKEQAAPAAPAAPAPEPAKQANQQPSPSVELPSFVNLVKQQGPAVVNVSAVRTPTGPGGVQMREGDPLFEFFRRFGGVPDPGEAPQG